MVRSICAVDRCGNRGVHTFPFQGPRRTQWLQAARLPADSKKHIYICSDHFLPKDICNRNIVPVPGCRLAPSLKRNAVPSIFPWNHKKKPPITRKDETDSECLKFDQIKAIKTYSKPVPPVSHAKKIPFMAVDKSPTQEDPLQTSTEECNDNMKHLTHFQPIDIKIKIEECNQDDMTQDEDLMPVDDINAFLEIELNDEKDQKDHTQFCEAETHATVKEEKHKGEIHEKDDHSLFSKKYDVAVQTEYNEKPFFCLQSFKGNNRALQFYTGFESYEKVQLVYNTLGSGVANLNYVYHSVYNAHPSSKIDNFDQFIMTLIVIYQHKCFEEMSIMYQISVRQVANIFITWVRFMATQWRALTFWVDKKHMPRTLNYICTIDYVKAVTDVNQSNLKTQRKEGLAVKSLIGIASSGLITFVSYTYSGEITDEQIIQQNSILQKSEQSGEVMVHKGIDVEDLFIFNGKAGFRSIGKKTTSKKVHLGRVHNQMKEYKILTEPMNYIETMLRSELMFICAMFVNFRSNLLPLAS